MKLQESGKEKLQLQEPGEKFLKLLPSIFSENFYGEESLFIKRYLAIFETIISGTRDTTIEGKKGITEMLDIISEIFHPGFSFQKNNFGQYSNIDVDEFQNEFLMWLASWMALVLKDDWELPKKREIIARIIPIYRMRGTKKGLEEYLKIYVGRRITVLDKAEQFQIGVTSHVGKKSRLGGLPPYFFIVEVDVMYMFSWDNIPGRENEMLLSYLKEEFGIGWAEGADIIKSGDGKIISVIGNKKSAQITLDEDNKKVKLTVGSQTFELDVKKENGVIRIYNTKNIRISDIKKWKKKMKAIENIINSEKPIHTDYWLNIKQPRMTLGIHSNIGENTLL